MHTIEIPDEKITLYLPNHLGECTAQQYMDMSELIFKYQTQQIDFDTFKVHAVYKLLNIVPSKPKNADDELQILVNVLALANKIESFFEINDTNQHVIKQDYINNPVSSISHWQKYHGPTDQFLNITFGEYLDALRLFLEFSASGDIQLLYLISAILYRPAKKFHFIKKHFNSYDGDIRIEYNPHLIEARAEKFKYLPIGFVFGNYLLFASFQKFLSSAIIPWAGRELDLSILFSNDNQSEQKEDIPSIGMDSILFSITESGVFGNKKETLNTKLWEVLVRMYDIRKRDLDQQKQQKQNDTSSSD